MNQADIYLLSLPYTWEDFGVLRNVFLNEKTDFFKRLTAILKQDSEFAQEVASFRWKFHVNPVPEPVPPKPILPASHVSLKSSSSSLEQPISLSDSSKTVSRVASLGGRGYQAF